MFSEQPHVLLALVFSRLCRNRHFPSKMQNRVQKLCRNLHFSSKMQNRTQKLCRNLHFPSKMQNRTQKLCRNRRFSSKMQNGVQKLCRNRRFSSKMQNGVQKLCRNLHFPSKMQNQALILCIKSIPSGGHAKYTFIQKTALLHRCFFTYFAALFFSFESICSVWLTGYYIIIFNPQLSFSVRLPASA